VKVMSLVDLLAVASDRFDWAAFHCLLAERLLFRGLRLLINVGVTAVVVAGEIGRSSFTAEIAVDALIIYVETSSDVLGILVCYFSHGRRFRARQIRKAQCVCNAIFPFVRCGYIACVNAKVT
jgi:hypothetical protein